MLHKKKLMKTISKMNTFKVPVQEPSYTAGGMQDLKKSKETIKQKKIPGIIMIE